MILAAGLGRRIAPLSDLVPKPALPVCGVPVLAHLFALLQHHGVSEVLLNVHHLADRLRECAEAWRPEGMELTFSEEERPLGTGGGVRRAAEFLRQSDPSIVLAGDMLLDLDLGAVVAQHRARANRATLVVRDDPRAARFGTLGFDREGGLRRIGDRFELPGEAASGVFVGVRVFSPASFDSLPDEDAFEDLTDWLAPEVAGGARDIQAFRAAAEQCTWEPVGTLEEYLAVNLAPPSLPFFDARAIALRRGVRFGPEGVVGARATVPASARIERCVVWDGEQVPPDARAREAVFAGGRWHRRAQGATA